MKREGAGEKGNENARGINFPVFFSFPHFIAVSPLEEPLQRRGVQGGLKDH